MKIRFVFWLVTTIVMVSSSCTSDDEFMLVEKTLASSVARASVEDIDTFTVYAIYKDVKYNSAVISKGDSLFYLDENFNKLMETIKSVPGSVSFIQNDSCAEYFDSQDDFFIKYGIRELTEKEKSNLENVRRLNVSYPFSRSITGNYQDAYNKMESNDLIYVALFDDTYYSDTRLYIHIKNPYDVYEIPYMKSVGLNDKVSSLMIRYNMDDPNGCAILTVWEDSNFNHDDNDRTKHRTNFVATYTQRTQSVGNLKKVSCFNAHDSWNDRISSISFHVGYADSLPKEY
ncbi:hypothetical protein [Phocaeicola sp.]